MKPYPDHAINQARRLRQDMTWGERRLWRELRKLDLNFRRQVPIGRYVADFACLQHRLLIEIDGGYHDLPERQLRDETRDAWLKSEGYRILRFRDQAVFDDASAVVADIIATLPPRGGKGRVGGPRAEGSRCGAGGESASSALPQTSCAHPLPCPSPLEGEGALYSEASADSSKAVP